MNEIERKWRLEGYPRGTFGLKTPRQPIWQAYISIGNPEVRVRKRETEENLFDFTLTAKSGDPPTRTEVTEDISEDLFELVWSCSNNTIQKVRSEWHLPIRFLPAGETSLTLEIDEFENGLLICEIEFSSEESASDFDPPDQFLEEVTQNHRYYNNIISKLGPPKPEGINY